MCFSGPVVRGIDRLRRRRYPVPDRLKNVGIEDVDSSGDAGTNPDAVPDLLLPIVVMRVSENFMMCPWRPSVSAFGVARTVARVSQAPRQCSEIIASTSRSSGADPSCFTIQDSRLVVEPSSGAVMVVWHLTRFALRSTLTSRPPAVPETTRRVSPPPRVRRQRPRPSESDRPPAAAAEGGATARRVQAVRRWERYLERLSHLSATNDTFLSPARNVQAAMPYRTLTQCGPMSTKTAAPDRGCAR